MSGMTTGTTKSESPTLSLPCHPHFRAPVLCSRVAAVSTCKSRFSSAPVSTTP